MSITAAGRGEPLSVRLLPLPPRFLPQSSIATRACFLSERSYPAFGILWHVDREGGGKEGVVRIFPGKQKMVGGVVQCMVVRSGPQGIKPELQNLTEGDLSLALPSGRSPPPYDHRRGCATRVYVCGFSVLARPAPNGPIGRLLSTLFLPCSVRECCASDASH